ncbi:serine hydrolase domain-containing protein [Rhodococcoides fascians]|uniref:serine hydrolase domain-containing protein n=1 Tax=Rhodococcoides fascians TaxID=1828 RepID=UPI000AD0E5AB|nr:D-alanyl-D-alanine carboxypeptidase [Rhodococcus fascians]
MIRTTLVKTMICSVLTVGLAATATSCSNGDRPNSPVDTSPTSAVNPADRPVDAALSARLDAVIDSAVKKAGLPGALVGIWGPGGSYVGARGVADTATKAPMEPGFYSRIGSVTKTFTVTALLQLVDQGKIGLDDPIAKYVGGVTEGGRITLRQLAGMRSGLDPYTSNEQFVTDVLSNPEQSLTPEQLLAYTAGHPLHVEPGTDVEYSNTNLILLGMVIEKVTGRPLADVIGTGILTPLKLTHTVFPTANEFPEPHARGYTEQTLDGATADATDWNPSWGWAAGAMISTLDDLRVWVPALAKGDLLAPGTQHQRLETHSLDPQDPMSGYGLGLFNVHGWIGHNGSLPGYKTVAVYLPEKDTTLVVFVNTDIDGPSDLVSALMTPITEILSPENVYS